MGLPARVLLACPFRTVARLDRFCHLFRCDRRLPAVRQCGHPARSVYGGARFYMAVIPNARIKAESRSYSAERSRRAGHRIDAS